MKYFLSLIAIAAFQSSVSAQESSNSVNSVQQQIQEIQSTLHSMEIKHQQEIDALKQKIQDQQNLINQLQSNSSSNSAVANPSTTTAASAPLQSVPETQSNPPAPVSDWKPSDPITVAGGGGSKNYLNMSFDGLFAVAGSSSPDLQNIETGGHDPVQRGFTVQNLEMTLDGAVDPYFTGQANFVAQINRAGETTVEAEEAWMQTSSLPENLQIKGGLFLSPFGRLNQTHPHTWDFVDQPLVNGRLLGPDGLRNPGLQVSYLTPLPWYSEVIVAAQNGTGDTAYSFRNRGDNNTFFSRNTLDRELRGPEDLLYVARWANSVDLNEEQTVVLGTSAAYGPNNTGGNTTTQIYGVDAFYKWKPSNASGGWPFVKWQSEAMYRQFEAGDASFDTNADGIPDTFLPRENFDDWGMYSQVTWGFSKGWVAGLRGDYLDQDTSTFTSDRTRENRWRISPNLTWYPTEFSKIRLQYNHDDIDAGPAIRARNVETVVLQFEFLLGAHGAHKF